MLERYFCFKEFANLPAIVDGGRTVSFTELASLVEERGSVWQRQGITSGERVALTATSNIACVLDLLALWNLGAIPCPLSPRLPPLGRETLLQRFTQPATVPPLATLLCTSGTTAAPKIAAHTIDNYLICAKSAAKALQLGPGASWHLSLPLYHVSGLSILFRCLVSGATLVLDKDSPYPQATHFSLVPAQLYRIIQDPLRLSHYRQARCLLIGGAPLSHTLHAQAIHSGLPIFTTWGMTETTAMATLGSPSSYLHAGELLSHMELTFRTNGEIHVRGPAVFHGYLEQGNLISPCDTEGWFPTRDLGQFDEQGCLQWLGRKDLLFISGGENIQPEEIETFLGKIPEVIESIVVPVENPEFGALPAAYIRTHSSTFDPAILSSCLERQLPRFKIPRWFFPFPSTDENKPNRRALQQLAQERVKTL